MLLVQGIFQIDPVLQAQPLTQQADSVRATLPLRRSQMKSGSFSFSSLIVRREGTCPLNERALTAVAAAREILLEEQ